MALWADRLAKLAQALATAGTVPDTSISTAETDVDLRLAPDGAGGVEWGTGGGGGGVDPWLVLIDCRAGSTGHTSWNTIYVDATFIGAADMESSGAQNDEIWWHIGVSGGTWTWRLLHNQGANRGTYHFRDDDVDVGTVDGYLANPGLKNVYSEVTGVVMSAGKHKVALKMASKNASASSYFGTAITLLLIRTA